MKNCAGCILGIPVPACEAAYTARVKQLTHNILGDNTHPLHKELNISPVCTPSEAEEGAIQNIWGIVQSACTPTVMHALPNICTNHFYTIVSPLYICMLYHWQSKSLNGNTRYLILSYDGNYWFGL